MAYRLTEPLQPPVHQSEDPIQRWIRVLQSGAPLERERAVRQLVRKRAETALLGCLASTEPATASLATFGLWECWLNEQGTAARRTIDKGIRLMERGDLASAEQIFLFLIGEFPAWAEALNKQATLLYLRRQPAVSLALCEEVVRLKPHHFGAWNGMALCAIQLGRWRKALICAEKALEFHPGSPAILDLVQTARHHLD